MQPADERLSRELDSFQTLWPGGFYEGEPLDPNFSLYSLFGYMGVSHAVYLTCIKPYVREHSTVLEIGPGRGAWTKTMLHARAITCLDALSAEHNGFHQYIGHAPHVTYHQVSDFACRMLPEDHFTYLFSYDALCHVSFEGLAAYARHIFPKLKPGAHGFWMVADYAKYNAFIDRLDDYSVLNEMFFRERFPLLRRLYRKAAHFINRYYARHANLYRLDPNEGDEPKPGRWYHAGRDRTCEMLAQTGYQILDADIGVDFRSPVIHFQKP